MDQCGEDPLLIDLEKSASFSKDAKSPLIPAPDISFVNLDNNPFDVAAGQINCDPFEMKFEKFNNDMKNPAHNDLETRFDLVCLNDSDDKTMSQSKNGLVGVCDSPKMCNTLVSSNNVDKIIKSSSKCNGQEIFNTQNNSVFSPIYSHNFLQVGAGNQNLGNSFSGLSDELSSNVSKKSSPGASVSFISPLQCVSEFSNNESETSIFLTGKASSGVDNHKDSNSIESGNVNGKNLNRSFAGFDRTKNQSCNFGPQKKSTRHSFVSGISLTDRNESKTDSEFSSKFYGSLNQGFVKTSSTLNSSVLSSNKQESPSDHVGTSTPHQKNKSPPVEILREAVRLSRSFSMGSTNFTNAVENNEDLFSIKPNWETLDSSSDEENCSDDSLKSLKVNIRSSNIFTPAKKTPDSEALKKFKKRLSLIGSADASSEKQPVIKQRSRSADRTISDSALKSFATKTCPLNLPSAVPAAKLEEVKLRPKYIETDVKAKRGPLKAFVPLKNMLRNNEPNKKTEQSVLKPQSKSSPPKSPVVKKSSIKPAASSTPKRLRKPLAENNAQDIPSAKISPKLRRSNSYEIKNSTPINKQSRSSSASRIGSGIKPPTLVSKFSGLFQPSPNKLGIESNTTPMKKIAVSMLKVRQNISTGKENISRFL